MFIDTHCHLDIIAECPENKSLTAEDIQKIKALIAESIDQKVATVITIGTNIDSSKKSITLAAEIPSVYGSIGIHPCDTTDDMMTNLAELEKLLALDTKNRIVGIGEIGLDFYHPGFDIPRQKAYFRAQIKLAITHNLPIIIHSRNAFAATINILDEYKSQQPRGVFHCFSEDTAAARQVLERGFFVGIDGHISYPKNNALREAIAFCGINNVLLETDAPFLAPQKVRGTKNHPRNIPLIAEYLAEEVFKNLSSEEIGIKTTQNARQLFSKIR